MFVVVREVVTYFRRLETYVALGLSGWMDGWMTSVASAPLEGGVP
jgi:hypothetical protein